MWTATDSKRYSALKVKCAASGLPSQQTGTAARGERIIALTICPDCQSMVRLKADGTVGNHSFGFGFGGRH